MFEKLDRNLQKDLVAKDFQKLGSSAISSNLDLDRVRETFVTGEENYTLRMTCGSHWPTCQWLA